MWLYMHGGSCVNCHGTNGKGGVPVMMGTAIPADLTDIYAAHTHGDEKMSPYNDDLLKRAITKGTNANGERAAVTSVILGSFFLVQYLKIFLFLSWLSTYGF